ncbi:hypothetical protein [Nocardiopsis dassonvillei]|uniref:hypothetical protein n=1 Tax=Nocardiopsis dassonvillei TaxID=2014 RepID=UPI00363D3EF0
MMTDQRAEERAALHAHPSAIEIIAADYPAWEISRDRDGTAHGEWQATRDSVTLSAPSPAGLLVRLETQELARLQADHGQRWKVWRTPRYWMATALVDGVEPTLMEETADQLEARMINPAPWGNIPRRGDR